MTQLTTLTFDDSAPEATAADALVLAATKGDGGVALVDGHGLPDEVAARVDETLGTLGAEGGADEVVRLAGVEGVQAPLVLVVGLPAAVSYTLLTLPTICSV